MQDITFFTQKQYIFELHWTCLPLCGTTSPALIICPNNQHTQTVTQITYTIITWYYQVYIVNQHTVEPPYSGDIVLLSFYSGKISITIVVNLLLNLLSHCDKYSDSDEICCFVEYHYNKVLLCISKSQAFLARYKFTYYDN